MAGPRSYFIPDLLAPIIQMPRFGCERKVLAHDGFGINCTGGRVEGTAGVFVISPQQVSEFMRRHTGTIIAYIPILCVGPSIVGSGPLLRPDKVYKLLSGCAVPTGLHPDRPCTAV